MHPTQSTRTTILNRNGDIANLLLQRDHIDLNPMEQKILHNDLKRNIKTILGTIPVRRQKPTVEFESKYVFNVIENVLWNSIPKHMKLIDLHLIQIGSNPLPPTKCLFKIGSWTGGDRDGNPFVTAELTEKILETCKLTGLRLYLKEMEKLHEEISMNNCSNELKEYIQDNIIQIGHSRLDEPYRIIFHDLCDRITYTINHKKFDA